MHNLFNQVELIFETSWEVCNKIGGIYTVLSTKADALAKRGGKMPVFIGPLLDGGKGNFAFIADDEALDALQDKMQLPDGMTVKTGYWDIPGKPAVILVDFNSVYPRLNDIYGEMWNRYGVDSLHAYGDYDEGCAFAIAAAEVMKAATCQLHVSQRNVIAHFNEWTTAMGLLRMQIDSPETATVFTTHATSIGRSICGNNKPLYDYFEGYHGDQMAAELNMVSKHSLEKSAAHAADCFTTVSEVTARECKQLLDIAPQVVTLNGFEPDFVPKGAKYAALRRNSRRRLLEVARMLTGKTFADDTFIVATSGRNEFRNKGLDVFIDAINRVSDDLRESKRDILALILVPGWVKDPLPRLLENLSKGEFAPADIDFSTHSVNNADSDMLWQRVAGAGINSRNGKVSLILVPCYLNGGDGVVDMPYYDVLPGLDMTVFASYYEPWGYTPLESIAFKVPTVSTDKAGFGQWILATTMNTFASAGVHVIERTDSGYPKAVEEIAGDIVRLSQAARSTLDKYRSAAAKTASRAIWAEFSEAYIDAFEVALQRRDIRVAQ